MKKITKIGFCCLLGIASLQSCVTVKEYQKSRINDSEMDLAARKSEKFEQGFYLYREGLWVPTAAKAVVAVAATKKRHNQNK